HRERKGRGQLHVGGSATRESDNRCGGGRDESCSKLCAGTEAAHVEVNDHHQRKSKCRRRKTRRPVVDSEGAKRCRGPPIIERRLLEPRTAMERRSNEIVVAEHFPRNLLVTGLVGSRKSKISQ